MRAQAEAQIEETEAALVTAAFNLSERTVQARVGGTVQDIYFRAGEYATSAPVLSILPPENVFIRFFVPEKIWQVWCSATKCKSAATIAQKISPRISASSRQKSNSPPRLFTASITDKNWFSRPKRARRAACPYALVCPST